MDPEIFARVVGGPSPTGRKEHLQLFSPQLILQWGPNVYFKETIIFPESKQGGGGRGVKNVRRSNLFQSDGAQLLFSIELVGFQGVPDSLYPLWIRVLPMCTLLCLWPFKVTKTKHAISPSKALTFRVIKKNCHQNYILFIAFVLGSTSRNH